MASEGTAAAETKVGALRRDPMAMLPFCGYNMGDYWGHWLDMGRRVKTPPAVFQVNWFQRDDSGKFIWPGFGQNMRVLRWVRDRALGTGSARESSIGLLPDAATLGASEIGLSHQDVDRLLKVDRSAWQREVEDQKAFLARFGDHLPEAIARELQRLEQRVSATATAGAR